MWREVPEQQQSVLQRNPVAAFRRAPIWQLSCRPRQWQTTPQNPRPSYRWGACTKVSNISFFEYLVLLLGDHMGVTPEQMRHNHTNLE